MMIKLEEGKAYRIAYSYCSMLDTIKRSHTLVVLVVKNKKMNRYHVNIISDTDTHSPWEGNQTINMSFMGIVTWIKELSKEELVLEML